MLAVDGAWVWDFWCAQDEERFHVFYLNAPRALGDENLRHRNARIGHAVSTDLVHWSPLPVPFGPGGQGAFDQTATWTGSVVRGDDGLWRMFYTGSRFLGPPPSVANIETIGVATSPDLVTWEKHPGPVVVADPEWYETYGSSEWHEEAWRDPWVFRDPAGIGWHMLVTARANHGRLDDRGVIGHAYSDDLVTWTVLPPLSEPGAGFQHLEVPQIVEIEGRLLLVFSCVSTALSAPHAARVPDAGTWIVPIDSATGPFDISQARPLTDHRLYAGKLLQDDSGRWVLLGFETSGIDGSFSGVISDPIPLAIEGGELRPLPQSAGTPYA
jgi:beta-fructofuranosidase